MIQSGMMAEYTCAMRRGDVEETVGVWACGNPSCKCDRTGPNRRAVSLPVKQLVWEGRRPRLGLSSRRGVRYALVWLNENGTLVEGLATPIATLARPTAIGKLHNDGRPRIEMARNAHIRQTAHHIGCFEFRGSIDAREENPIKSGAKLRISTPFA